MSEAGKREIAGPGGGAAPVSFALSRTVPSPDENLKVFVSYAREDLAFADQLVDALKITGFEPLIDRHRMTGGEDFKTRLAALILDCDTVAFIVSPDSVAPDSFCKWEIEESDRRSKRMIPVLPKPLGDTVVPERLKNLDYIFFYPEPNVPGSGFGNGLKRLAEALRSDLRWLQEHTLIQQRAVRWDSRNREEDSLLRGTLLEEAEEWCKNRPTNAPAITELQRAYLEASRKAQDASSSAEAKRLAEMAAAQAEREKALKEAEKALAEAKAAAAAREEEQKEKAAALAQAAEEQKQKARAQRRAGRLTLFAAALSVVTLAGALWQQRVNSIREARVAENRAASAFKDGNYGKAIEIALAGLPPPGSTPLEYRSAKLENEIRRAQFLNPEIAVLTGHTGILESMDISEDGSRLLTRAEGREPMRLWDTKTAKLVALIEVKSAEGYFLSPRFLDKGRLLMTSEFDFKSSKSRDYLWDAANGRFVAEMDRPSDMSTFYSSTDDGRFIFVAASKGVKVYSSETGGLLRTIAPDLESPNVVEIGTSNRVFVKSKGVVDPQVWDLETGTHVGLTGHVGPNVEVSSASKTEPYLFTFDTGTGKARLWDAKSGSVLAEFEHPGKTIKSAARSTDGKRVWTRATGDPVLRMWNIETGAVTEMKGAEAPVKSYSRSPTEQHIAVRPDGNGPAFLWNAATGERVAELSGHTGTLSPFVWSPDGLRLATYAAGDAIVRLWDTATGQLLKVLDGHAGPIADVKFSASGHRILTRADNDRIAQLWDDRTGERVERLQGHEQPVEKADFMANGYVYTKPLSASAVRIWNADEGQLTAVLNSPSGAFSEVETIENPSRILTRSSNDTVVRVWSADGTSALKSAMTLDWTDTSDSLTCRVCWIRSKDAVVLQPEYGTRMPLDKIGRVWRLGLSNFELTATPATLSPSVQSLVSNVITEDRTRFALWSRREPWALLFDAENGTLVRKLEGHEQALKSVRFSPSGRYFVTQSVDSIRFWKTSDGTSTGVIKRTGTQTWSVRFAGTSNTVVLQKPDDGSAQLWNLETGELIAEIKGHEKPFDLTVHDKGNWVLSRADGEPFAQLWDAQSGKMLARIKANPEGDLDPTPTADGKYLATRSEDGTAAEVWDVAAGKIISTLRPPGGKATYILQPSDPSRMLTLDENGNYTLWDVTSGKIITQLGNVSRSGLDNDEFFDSSTGAAMQLFDIGGELTLVDYRSSARKFSAGPLEEISGVQFSPDGLTLAVRFKKRNDVDIWDTAIGKRIATLEGHTGPVREFAFSKDGRRFLSLAINDNFAWAWDTATGAALATFKPMADTTVLRAEFGRDSSEVLIRTDNTVQLWQLPETPVLSGQELWNAVCAESAATSDRNPQHPCLRTGPFSPTYYVEGAQAWTKWVASFLPSSAEADPAAAN